MSAGGHIHIPQPTLVDRCCYCKGIKPDAFNEHGKPCHMVCHNLGRKMRRKIRQGKLKRKPGAQ